MQETTAIAHALQHIDANQLVDMQEVDHATGTRYFGWTTTALFEAARHGQLRAAEYLLRWAEVDMHTRLSNGQRGLTPLHMASGRGHFEVADLLLRRDADINAEFMGATALTLAAQAGHVSCVKLCLAMQSDISIQT